MKKLFITGIVYICLFLLFIGGIYGVSKNWKKGDTEDNKAVAVIDDNAVDREDALSASKIGIDMGSSSGAAITEEPLDIDADNKESVTVKGDISDKVTPFYYKTTADKYLLDMCYANLYNSDDSEDNICIAKNISCTYVKSKNVTTYRIFLKDDMTDALGNSLTADDVIFNYYLRSDLGYTGDGKIYNLPILGLKQYRYGVKNTDAMDKKIQAKLKNPDKMMKSLIKKYIIRPVLEEEYEWVCSLYNQELYNYITEKYPRKRDLFVYFFAYGTDYKVKRKKLETVMKDIVKSYGADYKKLGKVTGENYTKEAKSLALSLIQSEKKFKYGVKNISGIKKINDTTIEITVLGKRKKGYAGRLMNIYVTSLDKWGNTDLYNGSDSFGFIRGNADKVLKGKNISGDETGAYEIAQKKEGEYILNRRQNIF